MNLVTFCHPTHIYRSDSCPFGLRGYSDKGVAWQFEVPEDLRFEHPTTFWNMLPR